VKPRFVLDAWAMLAFIQGEEPAASRVRQLLQDAQERLLELFICIINLGEVFYTISRKQGRDQGQETLAEIRLLPLNVVSATDDLVMAAAKLKMDYAISYADAFAAALAEQLNATVATGDPEFRQLDGRIRLEELVRASR
jgi:predicted nucleic acid-binding protein